MTDVINWLKTETKDFDAGVTLLLKYSKNKSLNRMISKKIGQKRYQGKLIWTLEKMVGSSKVKDVKRTVKAKTKPKAAPKKKAPSIETIDQELSKLPERFTALEFSRLPDEIQELEKRFKELFKKRAFLRNRLEILPTDEDRHEAAKLIHKMTETITGILVDIDYYKKHGQLPVSVVKEDAAELDQAQLLKNLNNCRSRISRVKKKLKDGKELSEKAKKKYDTDLALKTEIEQKLELIALQQ